ncbi:EAL domain-containing protein [Fontimonas sp. SYSU GA230001]|uniref:EAL domain-containing protein n=1 Tax=Fontimonas sp. SYSU GA230001 TaxID=3142450 RepID=UPI0032B3D146
MQDRQADVRERERVLEALRASESRLRETQQLAHVGSWELDIPSQALSWSDEVFAIFELDKSAFKPSYDTFLSRVHPDDRARVDAAFRHSVETRQPYAIDHRLLMADGRVKHVHECGLTHYDEHGRPQRSLGTVQDVTERRRVERELAERTEQLGERIKELHCIIRVSDILERAGHALDAALAEIVEALPPAWMHPEIACARIRLLGREFVSERCGDSPWRMQQDIVVHGKSAGSIEVSYLEPRPERDEGPFLREERDLIRMIARKIGHAAERRKDEDRFRRLLESAPDAMVIVDREGRIVLVNAQTERLFGYARSELIGQPVEILVPERLAKVHRGHRDHYLQHPSQRPMGKLMDLSARRRDGSEFPVEISLGPLDTDDGALICAAVRDITERKRAELALQRLSRVRAMTSEINAMMVRAQSSEELYESACRIAVRRGGFRLVWIGTLGADGTVRPAASYGANDGYLDGIRIPIRPDDPSGRGPTATALREGRALVVNDIEADPVMAPWREAALARGFRASAAYPLWVDDTVTGTINFYAGEAGFFDEDEVALLAELASDLSFAMQSIAQRRKLDYLAYYDPLTQLANRALFKDRLTQFIGAASAGAHQLALLVLDIERFKALNDALGAAAGDALLRTVARRLQAVGGGERVARIGGDRFALIVPRITRTADLSAVLQERIDTELAAAVELAGETYHPSARIGIAIYPDDGSDAETLFRNAEAALKRAKASGDRYLFYTQTMNQTVRERLSLEGRIHRAVVERELALYYQPKIDLRSGRIVGVEALLRWPTEDGFATGCGPLIEVLEETGAILEVGRWAIRQALADRQRWRDAGLLPPPVAVNVSMRQLQHPAFVEDITGILAALPGWDAGVSPGIELELTESSLMLDIGASTEKLQRLRELGVPITIDDFGSGYSSLSYLSRLPISTLKIDQSFIAPMLGTERAANLVAAIISMARSLHLQTVAEGVETPEQAAFLRARGCDQAQGFLYSPAVPADQVIDWLRAPRAILPA